MRHATTSLLLLMIALHAGCQESKDNGALSVKETGGQLMNDIGIAAFPTPGGWAPNRSNRNTAVILTRQGANPAALEEMISIDIGTPVAGDVKGSADALATKFGGASSKLPFAIAGEEAYRVSIPPVYEKIMPRECIVVHHGQKVCFLFGGSKSKADIWPVLHTIAQSWTWK
ncbi:hypothetical protein [Lignipirellula cremea]|uniref:Uncharacterized protein n=1 Tax=Lignipirellula cremea TaxID=2528010 RepID=A0A518DVU9_9BACT|nr:hypothetical protein [Lignipirellula cremea]QDU95957.1 hypothetical protein Pla8534_37760 [Lignipirellula cremea]